MNNHVLSCVKERKLLLGAGVTLGVLQSVFSIAFSVQMGRLLDSALLEQEAIYRAIFYTLVLFLVSMLTEFAAQAARLAFSNASSYGCTKMILSHLAHVPGFVKRHTSNQMNLLYQDQDMLYSDCFGTVCETIQYFSATFFALILLATTHPMLAVWGVSAIVSLMISKSFNKSLDRSRKDMSQTNEQYYHELSQTINGYEVVKRTGAADEFCKKLSGGEKIKLSLACLITSEVNMLLLDEPTNYLDAQSVEALKEVLTSYSGTVIFASHDRVFIEAVAEDILLITNKKITLYPGKLSAYAQQTNPGNGRRKNGSL